MKRKRTAIAKSKQPVDDESDESKSEREEEEQEVAEAPKKARDTKRTRTTANQKAIAATKKKATPAASRRKKPRVASSSSSEEESDDEFVVNDGEKEEDNKGDDDDDEEADYKPVSKGKRGSRNVKAAAKPAPKPRAKRAAASKSKPAAKTATTRQSKRKKAAEVEEEEEEEEDTTTLQKPVYRTLAAMHRSPSTRALKELHVMWQKPEAEDDVGNGEEEKEKEKEGEGEADTAIGPKPSANSSDVNYPDRWVRLMYGTYKLGNRRSKQITALKTQTGLDSTATAKSDAKDKEKEKEKEQKDMEIETVVEFHKYDENLSDICFIDEMANEVLYAIFSHFARDTLARVSCVCRRWKEMAMDPHVLGKTVVFVKSAKSELSRPGSSKKRLRLRTDYTETEDFEHVTLKQSELNKEMKVAPTKLKLQGTLNDSHYIAPIITTSAKVETLQVCTIFQLLQIGSEKAAITAPWSVNSILLGQKPPDAAARMRMIEARRDGDWRGISYLNPVFWRWRAITTESGKLLCCGHFNVGALERYAQNGQKNQLTMKELEYIAEKFFGPKTLMYQYLGTIENSKTVAIPRWIKPIPGSSSSTQIPLVAQPKKLACKLYHYQLESLTWMKTLENRISKGLGWSVSSLLEWSGETLHKPKPTELLFNSVTKRMYFPSQIDEEVHSLQFYTRGGILADEMGLGKTVISIALVASNPQTPAHIAADELFDPTCLDEIRSKATLIVCPNHLCAQWESEFTKHFPKRTSVLRITTILQHRKITYRDVVNADVVLVSLGFLANKNYREVEYTPEMARTARDKNLLDEFSPVLHKFRWYRIIMDEAHEAVRMGKKKGVNNHCLQEMKSLFRWYVTGTPFPSHEDYDAAKAFLQFRWMSPIRCQSFTSFPEEMLGVSYEQTKLTFMQHLFCRHTKAGVENEFSLPEVQEQVFIITLSPLERVLYQMAKINRSETDMLALCSHPQISSWGQRLMRIAMTKLQKRREQEKSEALQKQEEKERKQLSKDNAKGKNKEMSEEDGGMNIHANTGYGKNRDIENDFDEASKRMAMKDINESIIELTQESITTTKRFIKDIENDIRDYQNSVKKISPSSTLQSDISRHKYLLAIIERKRQQMQNYQKNLAREETFLVWLKRALAGKSEKDIFADTSADTLASKPKLLRSTSTISIDYVQMEKAGKKQKAITECGSKLGHVLLYVKELHEDTSNHIILFSQFSKLLTLVGGLLNEHDIKNKTCKGNVYARQNAISAFQDATDKNSKSTRVLLLSLENTASGTNLTGATHLILIDPVAGSASHARALEAQAIGRAHRLGQEHSLTVVRFIVADSLEYESYMQNYGKFSKPIDTAPSRTATSSSSAIQDMDEED